MCERVSSDVWLCLYGNVWLCHRGNMCLRRRGTVWLFFHGDVWLCCHGNTWLCPRGYVRLCRPQCVSPSPLWLGQPLLLPHWNYIPHNAPHMGLVELIGSPILLSPGQGLALPPGGAELSRADGVKEAAARLLTR